jgi:hypothetical protein
MQHQDIVAQLAGDPAEILYAVRTEDLLSVLVNRLGERALTMTVDDLHLVRDKVKAAIDHHLDIRDFIDEGLDA